MIARGFAVLALAVLAGPVRADNPPSAFPAPALTATSSGAAQEESVTGPLAKSECERNRDTIVGVTELVCGLGGLAGTITFWRSPAGTKHPVSAWIVLPSYPLSAILGAEIGYRLGRLIASTCR
ncbi:MAG: hypothetical protein AAB152_03065 [Candidatus Coatesbacteria bacterium]